MKCKYCGYEIPDGMLYCEHCGGEVRIVPDYNPLDDMLAENIKQSIAETGEIKKRTARSGGTKPAAKKNDERRRRQQAKRRRERRRKRRRRFLAVLFGFLLLIGAGAYALYYFSYTGTVRRGEKALENEEYTTAEECFQTAISKNEKKPDAYEGLASVYLQTADASKAEEVFRDAIEEQPENAELYEGCILFYLKTDQPMKIPDLLSEASEETLASLQAYCVAQPEFSLDETQTYEDVQQLSLESDAEAIYYTTDGSDPDLSSTKYQEPIQLGEGTTEVRAIAVNDDGVPSAIASKEYVIELPEIDAPAVSPSTGQYSGSVDIEIKVPDGYTAYYTTNGKDPTTASVVYTGPIDMPDGDTLFKAILVDASGRSSTVTTRNYVRD